MKKHYDIYIYGRVQGVGFRWATMRKAQQYNLAGFVKNMPNGSLYAEAEGEEPDLEKFVAWCRKGPLWAKVSKVETSPGPVKDFMKFEITNSK